MWTNKEETTDRYAGRNGYRIYVTSRIAAQRAGGPANVPCLARPAHGMQLGVNWPLL
jgi:hypothetical protein